MRKGRMFAVFEIQMEYTIGFFLRATIYYIDFLASTQQNFDS